MDILVMKEMLIVSTVICGSVDCAVKFSKLGKIIHVSPILDVETKIKIVDENK